MTLELLGCWCKYEEALVTNRGGGGNLLPIISTTVLFLRQILPILLDVFNHSDIIISTSVITSCNKIVSVIKYQINKMPQIESFMRQNPVFI